MSLATRPARIAELLYGCNAQEIKVGAVGQEKFCRLVAAGHTIEKAYALAYEIDPTRKDCQAEALRLSRAPHIVARIMQIRAQGVKGYSVQREDLLEPLLWALNTARQNHSSDQVRKIVMDIGKLFGLVIDKVEANINGQFQVMRDVSVNGDSLVFDIGSGKQVSVKGESIEGLPPVPALHSTRAIVHPEDNTEALDVEGEGDTLTALQNLSKTLTIEPVELDTVELPPEATLNVGGERKGAPHIGARGGHGKYRHERGGPYRKEPPKAAKASRLQFTQEDGGDGEYVGDDML